MDMVARRFGRRKPRRLRGGQDEAASWLISRTIGFGGSSALELLAQDERQRVMQVLNHLRYGPCT
ncbi:MbcA/ParS/Xre antitoxin family protein [Paraburkholderia atlantica]